MVLNFIHEHDDLVQEEARTILFGIRFMSDTKFSLPGASFSKESCSNWKNESISKANKVNLVRLGIKQTIPDWLNIWLQE